MKLPPKDMELYRRVDEVLHYRWDPCQVANAPQARNEYYSYLPRVFQLVRGGADAHAIAEHLATIERERMGLPCTASDRLPIGELLVEWREQVNRQHF
jgi:hypothetical protein